jgi:single-stranded DNA-binding protein
MADMFVINFTGRLAKDAEVKVSKKGTNYVSLTVMSNFQFDRSSNSCVGHAIQLNAFNSAAKFAAGLKKGDKVFVTAQLVSVNVWQSQQDGVFRPYLNATVVAIQGAGVHKPATAAPQQQTQPQSAAPQATAPQAQSGWTFNPATNAQPAPQAPAQNQGATQFPGFAPNPAGEEQIIF